jgi:tyrosine aminotransferase
MENVKLLTILLCKGIETKEYNLLPDQDWEVDLLHMESLIDHNTAAMVVNSPSNPCGSVFSPAHLRQILDIAEMHKIPIIADEIYDNFVFPGQTYVPIASLTSTVPVLSCGGLTKRFLVPGWRMGWIVIYDRQNIFAQEVRKGLMCMSQRIIGSNTLVQGALPTILAATPPEFFTNTIKMVQKNANIAFSKLREVPGLLPVMPNAAMYMMVKVDMDRFPLFEHDLQFVETLVSEQSVFCLPGKCFNYPNYFRLVLTVPPKLLEEACDRMLEFCRAHLICPPPSRLVSSMIDQSSLYATYGKVPGKFVDGYGSDTWRSTWALAVSLAEAISNSRRNSRCQGSDDEDEFYKSARKSSVTRFDATSNLPRKSSVARMT